MERHDVALLKDGVEVGFHDAVGQVVFILGCVCQHLQSESCGDACRCHACIAQTDDAHLLAVQLDEVMVEIAEVRRVAPSAGTVLDGVIIHMADDVEQMAEHHLCHALSGVGRNVRHHDVLSVRHFEIHHIVASGQHADILQTWKHVQHRGVEHHFVGQHHLGTLASGYHFVGRGAFVCLHISQFFQSVPRQFTLVNCVCIKYNYLHKSLIWCKISQYLRKKPYLCTRF